MSCFSKSENPTQRREGAENAKENLFFERFSWRLCVFALDF
jgi:hypothetical protein